MLDNNSAPSNKIIMDAQNLFQLQGRMSHGSQRKFIFFDRCGGKNNIYFHPSLLKDTSGYAPSKDLSAVSGETVFHEFHPVTELLSLREPFSGHSEEMPPAYKRKMPLAFASSNEMHNDREIATFSEGCRYNLHSPIPSNVPEACASRVGWEPSHPIGPDESDGSLLNNTDDLEALLSSDDEASTGQSPGDNIWESETESQVHKHEKVYEGEHDKKTESDFQDVDGDCAEESNAHCSQNEQVGTFDPSLLPAAANIEFLQFSEKAIPPSCFAQSKLLADAPSTLSGSGSSSTMKRKHSTTLPLLSGSAQKFRSNQIKQTLRLLRSVIPGTGDHMDTAFVLDEAIQYVTSLQKKVQELEESKHLECKKPAG